MEASPKFKQVNVRFGACKISPQGHSAEDMSYYSLPDGAASLSHSFSCKQALQLPDPGLPNLSPPHDKYMGERGSVGIPAPKSLAEDQQFDLHLLVSTETEAGDKSL